MTTPSYTHQTIAWLKQRLDDTDAILTEIENSVDDVKSDARNKADAARERIAQSRAKLQKYYDGLRTHTNIVKQEIDDLQENLEEEWIEIELALREFTASTKNELETVRAFIAARSRAQSSALGNTLSNIQNQATEVIEKARNELDVAFNKISTETEKIQERIGEVKDAGDESWNALKQGFVDAKTVHDNTIEKIKDAFSKAL